MNRKRFVHLVAESLGVGVEVAYPSKPRRGIDRQIHLVKQPGLDVMGETLWEWVVILRSHCRRIGDRRRSQEITGADIQRIQRASRRLIQREQRLALEIDEREYFEQLEAAHDEWQRALQEISSEHVLDSI